MTLLDRVSLLFAKGHSAAPPDLLRDERVDPAGKLRPAAVLAAITDRADEPGFLLLHRPSNMRSHPGQIAFPGGAIDPGEVPIEAALREAWEELGIRQDDVRVIGASDVFRTFSGFEITPVVGLVPPDIEIVPNPAEVAQWFEAPASFVLDPANHKQGSIEVDGILRPFFEIEWQGHRIWGITAAILVNLSRRLRWHG